MSIVYCVIHAHYELGAVHILCQPKSGVPGPPFHDDLLKDCASFRDGRQNLCNGIGL